MFILFFVLIVNANADCVPGWKNVTNYSGLKVKCPYDKNCRLTDSAMNDVCPSTIPSDANTSSGNNNSTTSNNGNNNASNATAPSNSKTLNYANLCGESGVQKTVKIILREV